MSKIKVSEIFLSIQGEGQYTGAPSVFVRTIGCTLRCCWKSQLTGKVSLCDTPYTSHRCEEPTYSTTTEVLDVIKQILTENPKVEHVVFTGGEPLIYQDALYNIMEALNSWVVNMSDDRTMLIYTVETNGTIELTSDFEHDIDLISLSPKLPNSCAFDGTDIPQEDRDLHNRNRFKPEILKTYISGMPDVQIKFVASQASDEGDIKQWLGAVGYDRDHFPFVKILIMPEGQRPEEISKSVNNILPMCIANNWTLCDRLHIRIWGDKRGV